jgi:hypothetical protein
MTMNLSHYLWIVWAVFALVTALLYAYRTSVTRDEEGQIFLDDAFAHEQAVQSEIVSKVNRLQPILRASMAATVLMTVVVLAYYAWSVTKSLF